jgi:hypothetical protein
VDESTPDVKGESKKPEYHQYADNGPEHEGLPN